MNDRYIKNWRPKENDENNYGVNKGRFERELDEKHAKIRSHKSK